MKLIASNSKFSTTAEKLKYIKADTIPVSAFTSIVNKDTAWFANNSKYEDTLKWEFGDGFTSTERNPMHIYSSGTYIAMLITYSNCGTDTSEQIIAIGTGIIPPSTAGCILRDIIPLTQSFIGKVICTT